MKRLKIQYSHTCIACNVLLTYDALKQQRKLEEKCEEEKKMRWNVSGYVYPAIPIDKVSFSGFCRKMNESVFYCLIFFILSHFFTQENIKTENILVDQFHAFIYLPLAKISSFTPINHKIKFTQVLINNTEN